MSSTAYSNCHFFWDINKSHIKTKWAAALQISIVPLHMLLATIFHMAIISAFIAQYFFLQTFILIRERFRWENLWTFLMKFLNKFIINIYSFMSKGIQHNQPFLVLAFIRNYRIWFHCIRDTLESFIAQFLSIFFDLSSVDTFLKWKEKKKLFTTMSQFTMTLNHDI